MAIKNILFLDFETYYASGYTLRSMSVPEYLLDSRFEMIGCSVAVNNGPISFVDGPDFKDFLTKYDPSETATVTFNALFDNCILYWHYGFLPAQMYDTMTLARALRGHKFKRFNLETVGPALGCGTKGDTIKNVIGMTRADIMGNCANWYNEPGTTLWDKFQDYANNDNLMNRNIFKKLIKELPVSEHKIMDLVIRCAVEPTFVIDKILLEQHLIDVRRKKAEIIIDVLVDKANTSQDVINTMHKDFLDPEKFKKAVKTIGLMSNQKFQKLLEDEGIEIEYKTSTATGKLTPAFAKTDEFMAGLLEHNDPRIQALAAARVGVKSTLEETRTLKLINIANLDWEHYRDGTPRMYSGGTMPIPLRYAGAHTHRLSGDWKMNMQNMPRKSNLRKAITVPKGFKGVGCDLSQIEARLVAWLAGCKKLLEEFHKIGGDPYSAFASLIFGFPVNRKTKLLDGTKPHEVHGFIGKTGVLGLGFGCGVDKFFTMVVKLARAMGVKIDGSSGVEFNKSLAEKTVKVYRGDYKEIPELWRLLDQAVANCWLHNDGTFMKIGPVTISYGKIEGPGGLCMGYDNPRAEYDSSNGKVKYFYDYSGKKHIMYGAKMLENIIQFLARIIVMNAALRLNNKYGYRFRLQAHDELVFIVPENEVDIARQRVYQEMTTPPSWGLDIPLGAEDKSGDNYGF